MAKDIKTHNVKSRTIKTKQGTVKSLDRSLRAGNDIKNISSEIYSSDGTSADVGVGNIVQDAEEAVAYKGLKTVSNVGKREANRSIRSIKNARKNIKTLKNSKRTIKEAYKNVKQTAKEGAKNVSKSIKTAKGQIKTAGNSIKTASSATQKGAETAKATYNASKVVVREGVEAAKVTAKATAEAAKETVIAIKALVTAIVEAIAAGGWVAVLVAVLIIIVIIIAGVLCSSLGITFGNAGVGNKTLSEVQTQLNTEFTARLNLEKAKLLGYEQIMVRPAPTITQWSNIIATYAIVAEKSSLVPVELNDEEIELMRSVMWDTISFTTSEETVTSVETDEETGEDVTVETTYGIINVNYLTLDELIEKYNLSADEQQTLQTVLEMSADMNGIHFLSSGNGKMINPCPKGVWNGNDYPAYASSGNYHSGRDIACPIGTDVLAAADGKVKFVKMLDDSFGYHLMLDHGDEVYTLYGHCSEILVAEGQEVKQGQVIALSGNTGNSTGPHLHFEVRVGGDQFRVNSVDPLDYIG